MMRGLLLFAILTLPLQADARYKLAYDVKSSSLIRIVAGLAGLSRMSSEGDEVLLKGNRVMVKGEKSWMLLDYSNGMMLIIDHTDRTFERLPITEMRKRMEADIPGPLVDGLKRMFPAAGKGMALAVQATRNGDKKEHRSLTAFRTKHGLGYLLPAMESLVALLPGLETAVTEIKATGDLVEAMRFQVGTSGKVIDATVEIRDYREAPVPESELMPPAGYAEVK